MSPTQNYGESGGPSTVRALSLRQRIRRIRQRRDRSRAVSPVIAMIMLIATAVVLAAVLYLLVSGLTHGPGTASIGTAFALGSPVAGQCWAAGVTAHICGTVGDKLFNFTIEQSQVSLGDILFEVHASNGAVYKNSVAGGFAVMKAGVSTPIAYYSVAAGSGLAMTTAFTYASGYSAASKVTSIMYLVVGTGTPSSSWPAGAGNYITVIGMDHYSGATAPVTLP